MKKNNVQKMALPADKKNVTYILVLFATIYVFLLYGLGLYFGFYTAIVKLTFKNFFKVIIPNAILIIVTEYIREIILKRNFKYKKSVAFLLMVLCDVIINININKYDLTRMSDFLGFFGYILFTSISANLMLNYTSIRYGKTPNIFYRLIMTLYVYIIPITPNVHILIHTLIKLLLPYIIYVAVDYAHSEDRVAYRKEKISFKILNILLIAMMVIITMLVCCRFKYGALVIGSGSMTGTVDKGDVIIYEEYKKQKIKVNDILVFKRDNRLIVHRVIRVKNVNNENRYFTKGDANNAEDEGYVIDEDVVGVYKLKIKKIGNLTLAFDDIFEK